MADELTAANVMARDVVTIGPMCAVEEAAQLMVERRISALPVTEGGRVVGMVSETDVLRMFVRAMGAAQPSSRIDVALGAEPTALQRVIRHR